MSKMTLALLITVVLSGCGLSQESETPPAHQCGGVEEYSTVRQEVVDCAERTDTGYVRGTPFTITVVTVDGKPVERDTANAFWVMQQAAAQAGVAIRISSGFRTNAEQQYLYNCYLNKNCNNGNLAARPGYSNHQSGHALDLNTSSSGVYNWLAANGERFGFKRTVPSEAWHWEWWGGGPGGGICGVCEVSCKNDDIIIGADCGEGSCGAFGSSCVDDDKGARCVFSFCPDQGESVVCLDDTIIGHCSDGAIQTGDCGAYGAFCSQQGAAEARCVSAFCVDSPDEMPIAHDGCFAGGDKFHCDENGVIELSSCPEGQHCTVWPEVGCTETPVCPPEGEATVCVDGMLGQCQTGALVDVTSCADHGATCVDDGAARCVPMTCLDDEGTPITGATCLDESTTGVCTNGVADSATPCDEGTTCRDGACIPTSEADADDDMLNARMPGTVTSRVGCSSAGTAASSWLCVLIVLFFVGVRRRRAGAVVVALAMLTLAPNVQAADTWSDPAPGVRQLLRTAPGPLRIHASVIDIGRDDLFLRVTRPEERGKTTTSFAQSVGAVAAINGDFFGSGYQPVGLTVGGGAHWEGTADRGWSFMGCTVEKECFFDDHTVDRGLDFRWNDVIGGNGWRLLVDGNPPNFPNEGFYRSDRHPRSSVGLSADGKTLILAVVEGRRGDSIGTTFVGMADIMKSLGAHQALMLDGGGSSSLVVGGSRVSQLPSGASERVVANHLAVLRGSRNPACDASPNGRYCNGTVIHTCQGGQHMGEGDCAFFGASCGIAKNNVGVCVHPSCTNGPDDNFCVDDTRIQGCEYGRPVGEPGNCAAYGATCETEDVNSTCVSVFCPAGANATFCSSETELSICTDGVPVEEMKVDCAANGQICDATSNACVDPDPDEPQDGSEPSGQDDDEAKEPGQNNSAAPGEDADGAVTGTDLEVSSGGCSSTDGGITPSLLLLLGIPLLLRRRRRA